MLTDNDIIKSLELCANNGDCKDCCINPHKGNYGYCTSLAIKAALDLINRQKAEINKQDAEIEQLKRMLESYALQYGTAVDKEFFLKKTRAEAVKEFAEKLKKKSYPFPCAIGVEHAVTLRAIDDLAKEFDEKSAK